MYCILRDPVLFPSPYNRGPQNHFLVRLCNSTATLTAYVIGMKHGIDKPANALQTTMGLLHRPKKT